MGANQLKAAESRQDGSPGGGVCFRSGKWAHTPWLAGVASPPPPPWLFVHLQWPPVCVIATFSANCDPSWTRRTMLWIYMPRSDHLPAGLLQPAVRGAAPENCSEIEIGPTPHDSYFNRIALASSRFLSSVHSAGDDSLYSLGPGYLALLYKYPPHLFDHRGRPFSVAHPSRSLQGWWQLGEGFLPCPAPALELPSDRGPPTPSPYTGNFS